MKEDKLKAFVRENREAFDTEKAPSRVWDRMENDLDNQGPAGRSISMNKMWMLLAGVTVLFAIIGIVGVQYMNSDESTPVHYANIKDTDFQKMQEYYTPLLENKQQNFVQHVDAPSVIDELGELDEGFKELQSDYQSSEAGNKEIMMRLMKENYELRIKILEMAISKMKMDASDIQGLDNKLKKHEY